MTQPLVSVIVPVHNGKKYLRFALQSVLAQTYRPLEVIIVDDGSTDGSAAVAQSFADIRYLSQPQQGVAVARNRGLSEAAGDCAAFLDQDDLWTPEKLTVQMAFLAAHPDISYSVAHVRHFLEPGTTMPSWLKPELLAEDFPGFFLGNLVTRMAAFAQIGTFDPLYQMGSDSDWFARAKDVGLPMIVHPEALLLKRVHGENHSFETQRSSREILRLLKASIDRRQEQKRENGDAQ